MENSHKPVFINLLAIARYDQMPDYPIQFMTVGKLFYRKPGEALLQYVESQQDDETGEITASDISLSVRDGQVTMERKGDYSNTMVFSRGQRFEGVPEEGELVCVPIQLDGNSRFIRKSIRNCGLRQAFGATIVGIERGALPIVSPDIDTILAKDDILWLIGGSTMLNKLIRSGLMDERQ